MIAICESGGSFRVYEIPGCEASPIDLRSACDWRVVEVLRMVDEADECDPGE
jgi:hypothetical protein